MKCSCGNTIFDIEGNIPMRYLVAYDDEGEIEEIIDQERLSDKLKDGFFKCNECGKKTEFRVFVVDF